MKPKSKKLRKTSPYNYIHASNPNLVEFDFPTSKTLDYSFPKVNPSNSWDAHHNLQGFVTLKDLMLQKQEEDAKEMYNNRVNLGVEKKSDSRTKRRYRRLTEQSQHSITSTTTNESGGTGERQSFNKIQSRSLPKTPDYAQSFKPDDSDIIMTRSREGQKLRDFGYEFISGDDNPMASVPGSSCNVATTPTQPQRNAPQSSSASKKKGGLAWIHTERRLEDEKSSRGGSFKKSKNKLVADTLESFKTSSEKLFQFKYSNNNKESSHPKPQPDKPLKPVTSYLPLTLPLNRKIGNRQQMYNIQDENVMVHLPVTNPVKKSSVSNAPSDYRADTSDNLRKNSAPERNASYLTKLTFTTNKSAKEKKLLGSPRLHRVVFGRRDSETQQLDHEIFSPIDFKPRPLVSDHHSDSQLNHSALPHGPPPPPPVSFSSSSSFGSGSSHNKISQSSSAHVISNISPDYPNLEYPPVFEAETYSLSDPNTSLTLMRRRNHNQSK